MRRRKLAATVGVLALGAVGAVALIAARPQAETRPPAAEPPMVRVLAVTPEDVQLQVRTHGTVAPRTQSELVPEVAGRVEWISPALAAGGFFEADEPLLRLDRRDYEVALASAEAALARAESEAGLTRANRERSRALAGTGVVSTAELDGAENNARVAAAAVDQALAARERARLDLQRTELRAPFAGRVREKQVDVGQFVSRGTAVARLYAVDAAEVRLPIPNDELAHLDLPLAYRGDPDPGAGPAVTLRVAIAGVTHEWHGRVVRTEGEIDARTRMVHAVARIDDPYGAGGAPARPPLAVGLFVEADIEGRRLRDVVVLPRAAMRDDARVFVIDGDDRLRMRAVELVRATRETVVIGGGLRAGEQVVVSPLEAAVDGMRVRVQDAAEPPRG